jgi:hypothetical protein
MKRSRLGVLAFGAATVLALVGLPAAAQAEPSGGTEHFLITLTSPNSGPVLAFGAFNAAGTDAEGPMNTSGTGTSKFTFPKGTMKATHTDDGTTKPPTFDPKTCTLRGSGSGDYTLHHGTGAYAGISGSGEYTFKFLDVFAHTAKGCGNKIIGGVTVIKAHGPVSFGSE